VPLIVALPLRDDEADARYDEEVVGGRLLAARWGQLAPFHESDTISDEHKVVLLFAEPDNGSYATELGGAFYESPLAVHAVGEPRGVKARRPGK
jgi:hypothetical protein